MPTVWSKRRAVGGRASGLEPHRTQQEGRQMRIAGSLVVGRGPRCRAARPNIVEPCDRGLLLALAARLRFASALFSPVLSAAFLAVVVAAMPLRSGRGLVRTLVRALGRLAHPGNLLADQR